MLIDNIRIIGVNDIRFYVNENICLNRKNVIYHSEQFRELIADIPVPNENNFEEHLEFLNKIYDLFMKLRVTLTDVRTEVAGYY